MNNNLLEHLDEISTKIFIGENNKGIKEEIKKLLDKSDKEADIFEIKKVNFLFEYFSDNKDDAFKIYDDISKKVLDETKLTKEYLSDVLVGEGELILNGNDLIKNFDYTIVNDVSKNLSFFIIGTILSKLEKTKSKEIDKKSLNILENEFNTLESIGEINYKYYFEFIYEILTGKGNKEILRKFKNKKDFNIDTFIDIYLNSFEGTILIYSDYEDNFNKELLIQREKLLFIIDDIINIFELNEEKKYYLYVKIGDIFKDLGDYEYSYAYYDLAGEINISKSYLSYNNKFILLSEESEDKDINEKNKLLKKAEENINIFIENAKKENDLLSIGIGCYNKIKTFSKNKIGKDNYTFFLDGINSLYLFLYENEKNIDENKKIEILNMIIDLIEISGQPAIQSKYFYKTENVDKLIIIDLLTLKKEVLFLDIENFDDNFNEFLISGNKFLVISILLELIDRKDNKNKDFFGAKLINILEKYFEEILVKYSEGSIYFKENIKTDIIINNKPVIFNKYLINYGNNLDKLIQIELFKFNELIRKKKEKGKYFFNKYELEFINKFLYKYS